MIRSKKITNAARGQACTLNIVSVCNYRSDTVVFAHFPDESHGIARKSDDISGGFACSACHDVVDGRRQATEWEVWSDFYMRRAQTRTLRKLIEMGVVKVG